ncbi:MAG TPA: transglutaminase family protein [Paracoccaceae bacterium]|nr:transglutaminase family protein [Paracoccaceae bacterium]
MTPYALRLTVDYTFDRPLGAGRQLFRVLPAEVPGVQHVRRAAVTIRPAPAERMDRADFFGTKVIELAVPPGLEMLTFDLAAEVDRSAPELPLDMTPPVAALAAELAALRTLGPASPHHFLPPSPRIGALPEVAGFARDAGAGARTALETVMQIGRAIHRHMAFDAEATAVDTTPAAAFAQGRGVCQDFAQIMVGALRGLGIPAAYVAGYLRTDPPPGRPRLEGADAMHAWVRAWTGTEGGWIDHDPTNDCLVREDHIEVGFGRDYGDVAPVTGFLRLDGSHSGSHRVDIRPLSGQRSARR